MILNGKLNEYKRGKLDNETSLIITGVKKFPHRRIYKKERRGKK